VESGDGEDTSWEFRGIDSNYGKSPAEIARDDLLSKLGPSMSDEEDDVGGVSIWEFQ